jgi:hypothetical protein
MYFTDQVGNPLPAGAKVRVPSLFNHTGIIAYTDVGQQVVLHNSKKRGHAAVTAPEELNNGNLPVVVDWLPQTPEEGARTVQRALEDVQRGVRWSWFDNCQDFVSRALKGQNGSPRRDYIFLTGLCVLGLVFVANSK